jgi:hypothetical protein
MNTRNGCTIYVVKYDLTFPPAGGRNVDCFYLKENMKRGKRKGGGNVKEKGRRGEIKGKLELNGKITAKGAK